MILQLKPTAHSKWLNKELGADWGFGDFATYTIVYSPNWRHLVESCQIVGKYSLLGGFK